MKLVLLPSLYLLLLVLVQYHVVTTVKVEVCTAETLEAECPEGHAVVVMSALYGRLYMGRCLREDYGKMGCTTNVKSKIEALCSGRQRCSVDVFRSLQEMRPADCSELDASLEVDYSCVQVEALTSLRCQGRALSSPHGYLPSFSPTRDIISQGPCSLQLVASKGQTWNLTLLDFGSRADDGTTSGGREMTGTIETDGLSCTRYAVVKETTTVKDTVSPSVICGNPDVARKRNIYLSKSNIVEIDLSLHTRAVFLIEYQVIGCEPPSPNIAHIQRDGNRHVFYCNTTGETWSVICRGNHWEGQHRECGTVPKTSEFRESRNWNSATGLLIVVGLGLLLGVVIGVSLLGLVICYYKRRKRQQPQLQPVYTSATYGTDQRKQVPSSFYKTTPRDNVNPTGVSVEYARKPPTSTEGFRYPYHSCSPGGHFPSVCVTETGPVSQARAHAQNEEDMTSMNITSSGMATQYGGCKIASDTSSNNDHVYEIPS